MSDASSVHTPKVWTNKPSGGRFANINRPISGSTHEKELPVGRHPLQLYSLGTPNGVKVLHSGYSRNCWRSAIEGRRVRRLADQDRRRRSVRQRFRGDQSKLQDPGVAGPQRPEAHTGVRDRRDPGAS